MIDRRLSTQIEPVAERFRQLRVRTALSITWLAAAAVGVALLMGTWAAGHGIPWLARTYLAVVLFVALVAAWVARRSVGDVRSLARRIEQQFPDLDARLLAAVEQESEYPEGRFGYLQETVIQQAVDHGRLYGWSGTVSARRLRVARLVHLVALALFVTAMVGLVRFSGPEGRTLAKLTGLPIHVADEPFDVEIDPGDAEIERGTSLPVLARFSGPLPSDVRLVYQPAPGEDATITMTKSLDDPLFFGRIGTVDADFTYRVAFADQETKTFQVTVFEYPRLEQSDAELTYPEYTSLEPTVIEDTRRITAVEGTKLRLLCHLNKPVAEPRLVDKDENVVELAVAGDDPALYETTFTLAESHRYTLHLTDAEGRENQDPPEIIVNVTPNRRPELKLAFPSRDMRVSPIEELLLKVSTWDDFGLERYGLSYSMAGAEPKELVLGESVPAKERKEADHVLSFEALEAEPDQLVSYYFWADDAGPDGAPRRTMGDMYFAEVRPFEEIFREGQQPPGGQQQQQQQGGGQAAREAEQLAELQKQIINATWKLIRRETSATPTDAFAEDIATVEESQQSAIEQAAELGEQLEDPDSQKFLAAVVEHMQGALEQLTAARSGPSLEALQPAMSAEQAAYEALLKLQAREHRVTRGNPGGGGGGGGGGNRSQQQLQQLELSNSENRYEQQSSASQAQQQDEADREVRQVLNRLRELAQRQDDLNKRIEELKSALEQAATEEEREELERQLKRLRDEEQQMLRDSDELLDRMDQPVNQERMADARDRLEDTRSNVRRASEALDEGKAAEAAAAGTRVSRELNELRDEFRQQASGQFTKEMREMRQQAQQLDEREEQVSEQLAQLNEQDRTSLRRSDERTELADQLAQQREELKTLLEDMQRVVQEAETAEPLLADQLYDAHRRATQQKLDETLEATGQLFQRGFLDEAQRVEQQARSGIDELARGVEEAAESVLGDETEALRRAQSELESLAQELNRELAQADPQFDPTRRNQQGQQPGDRQSGQQQGQQGQRGQPGQQQGQRGQQQGEQGQQQDQQVGQQGQQGQQSQQGQQGQQGQQPGQQGQQGQQGQGGQQPGQQGQQPGGQQGQQGQGGQQGQQPGQQQGQQGQQGQGGQQGGGQQPGGDQPREGLAQGAQRGGPGGGGGNPQGLGGFDPLLEGFRNQGGPITGDGFRDWSDRLRDVEEMIDDPELRAEVARIRDRARGIRAEFKRHSEEPNWSLVKLTISEPLDELRDRVAEELLRRGSKDALVPIDRDPVPPKYAEQVRRYYESLGSGR